MSEIEIGALTPRQPEGALRCAFCHGELPRGGVSCPACRALHHRACLLESPSCATCKVDLRDVVAAGLPLQGDHPGRGGARGAVALLLAAAAVVGGLGVVSRVLVDRWTAAPLDERLRLDLGPGSLLAFSAVDVAGRVVDPGVGAEVRVGEHAGRFLEDGRFVVPGVNLPEGESTLRVEVRDRGAAVVREVPVVVDTQPPALEVLEPAEGYATAADAVRVVVRATDASPTTVSIQGAAAPLADGVHERTLPLPLAGSLEIAVVAIDRVGHASRARRTVTRRRPELSLRVDEPVEGAVVTTSTVRVSGRVTADVSLAGARLQVNQHVVSIGPDGAFDAQIVVDEGPWRLEIAATLAGERAQASRHGVTDRLPPVIQLITPSELMTPHDWVELSGWVEDAHGVVVTAAGASPVSVERSGPFRLVARLEPDARSIVVMATDDAGNTGRARVEVDRAGAGPEWFQALPPGRRPGRLPRGLCFGAAPGEFVWTRDASVLVWVPGRAGVGGVFIGKYEVTALQARGFARAVRADGAWARRDDGSLPARGLTWEEAQRYVDWAGLRLPTLAEWRAAALGEDGRPFPWGHEPTDTARCNTLPRAALIVGPLGGPRRVDGLPGGASPLGCLNMVGNVAEWLADEPRDDDAMRRLHVGGSWGAHVDERLALTSAHAGTRDERIGLRVCLDP